MKDKKRTLLLGFFLLWMAAGAAYASNTGGLPSCQAALSSYQAQLNICTNELSATQATLSSCQTQLNVCTNELSAAQAFPATGQTTSYAAGDDGALTPGTALSYTDNGDGTITDNDTKLMWEKKDQTSMGPHNVNNIYPWSGSCSVTTTDACGTDADCPAGESCLAGDGQDIFPLGMTVFQWVAQLNATSFAGHTDWRLPDVKELQSIQDYGTFQPQVAAAFNTACSSGCTITSCSCTQSGNYWSSTTNAVVSSQAWMVNYGLGGSILESKLALERVRAVRGSL
jgi:hypothetical protein